MNELLLVFQQGVIKNIYKNFSSQIELKITRVPHDGSNNKSRTFDFQFESNALDPYLVSDAR